MQVDVLEHLKLSCFVLELIKALRFVALELDKFLLLARLSLHIVLEALYDLLLGRDLVLGALQLLLKDLLTLLSLSQLLPQHRIAAQLLLHIVHLVVELLLLDCLFQLLQHP